MGGTATAQGGAAISKEEGPIKGGEREGKWLGPGSAATDVVREMQAAKHRP